MKTLFTIFKLLIFIAFIGLLGAWGSLNQHVVTWHWIAGQPQEEPLNYIMGVLLAVGFVIGMLATLYILSALKVTNALKKRRADKEAKKREQNKALAEQTEQHSDKTVTE